MVLIFKKQKTMQTAGVGIPFALELVNLKFVYEFICALGHGRVAANSNLNSPRFRAGGEYENE